MEGINDRGVRRILRRQPDLEGLLAFAGVIDSEGATIQDLKHKFEFYHLGQGSPQSLNPLFYGPVLSQHEHVLINIFGINQEDIHQYAQLAKIYANKDPGISQSLTNAAIKDYGTKIAEQMQALDIEAKLEEFLAKRDVSLDHFKRPPTATEYASDALDYVRNMSRVKQALAGVGALALIATPYLLSDKTIDDSLHQRVLAKDSVEADDKQTSYQPNVSGSGPPRLLYTTDNEFSFRGYYLHTVVTDLKGGRGIFSDEKAIVEGFPSSYVTVWPEGNQPPIVAWGLSTQFNDTHYDNNLPNPEDVRFHTSDFPDFDIKTQTSIDSLLQIENHSWFIRATRKFIQTEYLWAEGDEIKEMYQNTGKDHILEQATQVGLMDCDVANLLQLYLHRKKGIPSVMALGFESKDSEIMSNEGHGYGAFHDGLMWRISDATPIKQYDPPLLPDMNLGNMWNSLMYELGLDVDPMEFLIGLLLFGASAANWKIAKKINRESEGPRYEMIDESNKRVQHDLALIAEAVDIEMYHRFTHAVSAKVAPVSKTYPYVHNNTTRLRTDNLVQKTPLYEKIIPAAALITKYRLANEKENLRRSLDMWEYGITNTATLVGSRVEQFRQYLMGLDALRPLSNDGSPIYQRAVDSLVSWVETERPSQQLPIPSMGFTEEVINADDAIPWKHQWHLVVDRYKLKAERFAYKDPNFYQLFNAALKVAGNGHAAQDTAFQEYAIEASKRFVGEYGYTHIWDALGHMRERYQTDPGYFRGLKQPERTAALFAQWCHPKPQTKTF